VPSLGPYLDALAYHMRWYRDSRPGLAVESGLQVHNLTQYLYSELGKLRDALVMVMEEDVFMEAYLDRYVRKPFFVYGTNGPDGDSLQVARMEN